LVPEPFLSVLTVSTSFVSGFAFLPDVALFAIASVDQSGFVLPAGLFSLLKGHVTVSLPNPVKCLCARASAWYTCRASRQLYIG
jgi:hypothetical protein